MAVTVTGNDGVVFTFLDEEISRIRVGITGQPEQYGQIAGGPADAYIADVEGPVKSILVSGRLIEAGTTRTSSGTTTTITQQIQWLEKQFNGFQLPRAFSSNYAAESYSAISGTFVTTRIIMGDFEHEEFEGNPQEVSFTIRMIVGTE